MQIYGKMQELIGFKLGKGNRRCEWLSVATAKECQEISRFFIRKFRRDYFFL